MAMARLSATTGVGRTEKPVTGFRSRAGRTFRAKLKLEQNEEGKWRVDFDEDWAREPRPTPPAEETDGDGAAPDGDGAKPAAKEPAKARTG